MERFFSNSLHHAICAGEKKRAAETATLGSIDNLNTKQKTALIVGGVVAATAIAAKVAEKKAEKTTYKVEDPDLEKVPERKKSFYEKHVKRGLDVACATAAITVFSPLYVTLALLVRKNLGSPVLFTQDRPGEVDPSTGKEIIFKLYKFRTMTDERGEDGELLPDEVRLTKFGAWLRSTSLDELPEAFNILNGTMSVIGPRPQLVRDMVFMSKEERRRHTAKPGLSGLAQVNGRNAISWEDRLSWDNKYIKHISFIEDVKILLKTVQTAFIKHEGITEENVSTSTDFGDYLLNSNKVNRDEYDQKQSFAKHILESGGDKNL